MATTLKHSIPVAWSEETTQGMMDMSPMPATKKWKGSHVFESEAMDITPQKPKQTMVARPFGVRRGMDKIWGVQSEDCFQLMLERENLHRDYLPNAKWLQYRRVLVDWMCEAGDEFNLHLSTMHVSVMLLDRILHSVNVTRNKLQLVAIACILIAAKYEETEEAVPSLKDMDCYAEYDYGNEAIYNMEIHVLTKLNWCLGTATPLHFAGYFMSKGVLFVTATSKGDIKSEYTDTMQGRPLSLVKKVPQYLKRYVEFFAGLCLQDYSFQQYAPSLMSAAIIMASRRALGISPIWRPELAVLTTYPEEQVVPCFQAIWQCYRNNFPAAPQTGADEMYNSPESVQQQQ